ncbi:DUF4097 family beta strand repeat-containing protein [Streptomyces sp. SYSU K217416]
MALRTRTLLAAGGALVAALVVTGCGSGSAVSDDKEPETRAFALSGTTLTVDSDGSDIEIAPADVKELEVTRWFSGWTALGEDPKVTWALDGGTLKLRTECDALINDCAVKHRIKVPRGVVVKVVDDNGSVVASGFDTTLTVRTDNGDVTVKDVSGALDLKTDNGNLRVSGVTSPQVVARSDNGDVRLALEKVPGRVETTTDNGDVTVELPRAAYKVTAESDNGDVHVKVDRSESSAHVVTARSDNGEVTVRSAN